MVKYRPWQDGSGVVEEARDCQSSLYLALQVVETCIAQWEALTCLGQDGQIPALWEDGSGIVVEEARDCQSSP